jgi:hypothetical protein
MPACTAANTPPRAPSTPPEPGSNVARPSAPNRTVSLALSVARLSARIAAASAPRPLLAASSERSAFLTSFARATSASPTRSPSANNPLRLSHERNESGSPIASQRKCPSSATVFANACTSASGPGAASRPPGSEAKKVLFGAPLTAPVYTNNLSYRHLLTNLTSVETLV